MDNAATILLYGRDPDLLATRRMVLQSSGYKVWATAELSGVDRITSMTQVDLAILCHSLTSEECGRAIAQSTSRWPRLKYIVLTASSSACAHKVLGEAVNALDGPVKLLSAVERLVPHESGAVLQMH